MLTENNYTKGMAMNEQIKYNIAYDRTPLFDIVCAGLAAKLLASEYANELTDEQRNVLESIINK